jgi:hypothetical protein
MSEKSAQETGIEADWEAAEGALAEARNLRGSPRFAALKRAGQLRYDAHKRRQAKEPGLDFKAAIRKAIMEDEPGRDR